MVRGAPVRVSGKGSVREWGFEAGAFPWDVPVPRSPGYCGYRQPGVLVDVAVGGRGEALDQRDGAAVTFVCLQPGAVQKMARDQALHHLQHRGDQFRLRGQQQTPRYRRRQNPLSHRTMWDDVVHQVRPGLRHAPRAA